MIDAPTRQDIAKAFARALPLPFNGRARERCQYMLAWFVERECQDDDLLDAIEGCEQLKSKYGDLLEEK